MKIHVQLIPISTTDQPPPSPDPPDQVFHYTTGTRLRSIVNSGAIKPTTATIEPHEKPVADFTLVAATTEPYQIIEPLRQRAKLHLELSFLTESDLVTVVERRCCALSWDIEPAVLPKIAKRARGVPRLALRLTASARRVSRADGRSLITIGDLQKACALEQLDTLGLGPLEQKYMQLLMGGHSARQNRPRIGAQNRPPCGGYWTEESSCSNLLARGVIRLVRWYCS
jgi:hypothetical protein